MQPQQQDGGAVLEQQPQINSYDKNGIAQPTTKLEGAALLAALKKQVEFYFSRANLSVDAHLVSQMNADMQVPIYVISQFRKVRALTNDVALIAKSVKDSTIVTLDEASQTLKPAFSKPKRNKIILRDVPANTEKVEIEQIFAEFGIVEEVRSDVGNTWFVTMKDEESAKNALLQAKLAGKEIGGKAIKGRLKSENLLRSVYKSNGVSNGNNSPNGQPDAVPSNNRDKVQNDANNIVRQQPGFPGRGYSPYGMIAPMGMFYPGQMYGAPYGNTVGMNNMMMFRQQGVHFDPNQQRQFGGPPGRFQQRQYNGQGQQKPAFNQQHRQQRGGNNGHFAGQSNGRALPNSRQNKHGNRPKQHNQQQVKQQNKQGKKSKKNNNDGNKDSKQGQGKNKQRNNQKKSQDKKDSAKKTVIPAPAVNSATDFPSLPSQGVESGYQRQFQRYQHKDLLNIVRKMPQSEITPPKSFSKDLLKEQAKDIVMDKPHSEYLNRQRTLSMDQVNEAVLKGKPIRVDRAESSDYTSMMTSMMEGGAQNVNASSKSGDKNKSNGVELKNGSNNKARNAWGGYAAALLKNTSSKNASELNTSVPTRKVSKSAEKKKSKSSGVKGGKETTSIKSSSKTDSTTTGTKSTRAPRGWEKTRSIAASDPSQTTETSSNSKVSGAAYLDAKKKAFTHLKGEVSKVKSPKKKNAKDENTISVSASDDVVANTIKPAGDTNNNETTNDNTGTWGVKASFASMLAREQTPEQKERASRRARVLAARKARSPAASPGDSREGRDEERRNSSNRETNERRIRDNRRDRKDDRRGERTSSTGGAWR